VKGNPLRSLVHEKPSARLYGARSELDYLHAQGFKIGSSQV